MMPPPAVRPTQPGTPMTPTRPVSPPDQASIPTPPAAPSFRFPPEVAGPPAAQRPPAAPAPAAAAPTAPKPAGAPGRPVNPFMSQDPGQKARRLARALISDLVVYYPDRRKEGIANGTLKTLFQEEIAKSWEEYTEQVGKELASSTTHFTDALNEILAGGQKQF